MIITPTNYLLLSSLSLSLSLSSRSLGMWSLPKILQIANPPHHHQPALHTKPYLSPSTKEEIIWRKKKKIPTALYWSLLPPLLPPPCPLLLLLTLFTKLPLHQGNGTEKQRQTQTDRQTELWWRGRRSKANPQPGSNKMGQKQKFQFAKGRREKLGG